MTNQQHYKTGIIQKSFLQFNKGDLVKYIDGDCEDIILLNDKTVSKIAIEKGIITEAPKRLVLNK
jgi:hypothetical protein